MPLLRLQESTEILGEQNNVRKDFQTSTFSIDPGRAFLNTWDELKAAQGQRGFDVIVVGSGMYGAYCAACLYEFGKALGAGAPRIVVLESGPFLLGEHVQNLTDMLFTDSLVNQPLAGPASQQSFQEQASYKGAGNFSQHARCVGGKSLFWGGWAPRMDEPTLRAAGSPWPAEAVDYLFQPGVAPDQADDGYPFVEVEIGVSQTTDFLSGTMLDTLLARAGAVFGGVQLDAPNATRLEQPRQAPVAVQGSPPLSGLFSFDKFSSLPRLLSALRNDIGTNGPDTNRRLFLVPNANVLRVLGPDGFATGVQVAVVDRPRTGTPKDPLAPEVCRFVDVLSLSPGGMVVLAGNTINSTRLALNSFRRPPSMGPELMGRNLMVHVRTNHVWQVKRGALGLPVNTLLGNAAMHVPGTSRDLPAQSRPGRFHFQFYASANVPPGSDSGPEDAEQYLYRLLPNFDEIQDILAAQNAQTVALGIRTCGETFGARGIPIPTNAPVSWMDVSPFVEEVFVNAENQELARVPRQFVRLVETNEDKAVREDEKAAAFQLIAAMTGVPVGQTGQQMSFQQFLASPNQVRYLPPGGGEDDGIGTTYHECGTLWMGDDPFNSVTDVHGRLHHVGSVACVDQALFPTSDSANPVPTGLALARKVARGVVARYWSAPGEPLEAGFTALFDGTFNNWSIADAPNFFVVSGGGEPPLIGAGLDNENVALGVLLNSGQFSNFDLRLQFRTFSPKANGGVFLRAPQAAGNLFAPGGFYDQALEIQIDERGFNPDANAFGSPLHRTGALYGRLPSNRWVARGPSPRDGRPGYWNDLRIVVDGAQITVELNGEGVCQGPHSAALATGRIGLQCHTEVVQYRNLRIRALP